ncbi:MAG: DUF4168 domain-containing protein [Hormoscilla sp.]
MTDSMTPQFDSPHRKPSVPRHWHGLGLGMLVSIASIVSGCVSVPPPATPDVPPPPDPVILSDEEITNYAKAVLAIEPFRRAAYNQAEQITGQVPLIICNQPNTIADLPKEVKSLAINYCNKALEIAQMNGFTVTRFNDITAYLPTDREQRKLIEDELLRQQRNSFIQ